MTPPPPSSAVASVIFLILLLPLSLSSTCPPPPFSSHQLHFPFSPPFQLHCTSSNTSSNNNNTTTTTSVRIRNLSFSLLHFTSPSSLLLLPEPEKHNNRLGGGNNSTNCFSPISFTGTPFTISPSTCLRLYRIKPSCGHADCHPSRLLPDCPPPSHPLPHGSCSAYETMPSNPLLTNFNNSTNCFSPISFGNSPFTVSPFTYLHLYRFRHACSYSNCHLSGSPSRLLPDCPLPCHPYQGCSHGVLSSLEDFLFLGIEVKWNPQDCAHCKANKTKCGFDPKARFACPQATPQSKQAKVRCVVISVVFVIFLLLISALIIRSRRRKLAVLGGDDPTVLYLHRHRSASLLPPVFTYEELEMATNRFDLRRKIGDGGFGSVFLGQLYDGRIVAVKHLHRRSNGGKSCLTKSFCNEILILSSIEHPNLVKLHGYCSDTRGLILVYDYVSNGTLFEHLHKRAYRKGTMTWQVRVEIALQVALAIEYLHFSVLPPIVHRDITSSNIFVEKDMRIKVGDFGLSRLLVFSEKTKDLGSEGCVWTGPQGTPGYLDPDYHRSFRLTEKSDVYSFGVVLLELVTGMMAVDQRREKREVALAEMVVGRIQMGLLNQVVDPALVAEGSGGEAVEGVGAVAELAFRCVAVDKDDRPDAREVVDELRRICIRIRCGGGVLRGSNLMNVVVPNGGV